MTDDRDLTESAAAVDDEPAVEKGESEVEVSEEISTLDRALQQRDEYLDALQRMQAEFENYRKRTMRQQTDVLERATESLLERLLPVLDAFDLALAHDGVDTDSAYRQIASLLRDTLAREGLERIDEVGVVFDTAVHDAVAQVAPESDLEGDPGGDGAGEDDDEGTATTARHDHKVLEVLRAGYRLKGRVIRPAMVKVEG